MKKDIKKLGLVIIMIMGAALFTVACRQSTQNLPDSVEFKTEGEEEIVWEDQTGTKITDLENKINELNKALNEAKAEEEALEEESEVVTTETGEEEDPSDTDDEGGGEFRVEIESVYPIERTLDGARPIARPIDDEDLSRRARPWRWRMDDID